MIFSGQTLAQALWRPFETEFGDFEATLRRQNKEVDEEIRLAEAQAAYQERKSAAEHRKHELVFRNKAIKDTQEWRLQKDQQEASTCSSYIHIFIITVSVGDDRRKLLDKLSSHDYLAALRRIRKQRYGQTSSWLGQSKHFNDWLDDTNSGTLWLSGIRKVFLAIDFSIIY